ncbi:MAG: hypothetical protein Q7S39_12880, partial [Ignavibacteria bacterium]|nr:hypothetical protein [Ignavibacteria bacterium]
MKKVLSIFSFLIFLSSFAFGQVEISTRLSEALQNAESTDYIRTLVYLRDQVDILSLDQRLYEEKATLQRRAFEVITALQEKANNTQGNLASYFQSKVIEGKVFNYQSYWIANMFMVEAQPEVIQELFTRMDVGQMDLDAILELDRPIIEEKNTEGIESSEPGLRIINAHLLWQLGITGAGRIVMNMDTGVLLSHPALQFKWRG